MQRGLIRALMVLAVAACPAAQAGEPCAGYKWDLHEEHALFETAGTALSSTNRVEGAPSVRTGRLYILQLLPQADVAFAVPPGKEPPPGSYAGLALLEVAGGGDYRVSADIPVWLDVALDGKLAAVADFQGQHACDAPRKVVLFELKEAGRMVLQVSGAAGTRVRLTVTKAPAAS